MFKNRSFLVKVVKDAEKEEAQLVKPFDYEGLISALSKASILLVATYMGASTLRAIVVHVVATKVN
jgi:hypothetical protein